MAAAALHNSLFISNRASTPNTHTIPFPALAPTVDIANTPPRPRSPSYTPADSRANVEKLPSVDSPPPRPVSRYCAILRLVLEAALLIWAVYTTVRYAIASVVYRDDHIRRRLAVAFAVFSGCAALALAASIVVHILALPTRTARQIISALNISSCAIIYSISLANVILVSVLRRPSDPEDRSTYARAIQGRCTWDIDVVISGTGMKCGQGLHVWTFYLAASLVRFGLVTAAMLALYFLVRSSPRKQSHILPPGYHHRSSSSAPLVSAFKRSTHESSSRRNTLVTIPSNEARDSSPVGPVGTYSSQASTSVAPNETQTLLDAGDVDVTHTTSQERGRLPVIIQEEDSDLPINERDRLVSFTFSKRSAEFEPILAGPSAEQSALPSPPPSPAPSTASSRHSRTRSVDIPPPLQLHRGASLSTLPPPGSPLRSAPPALVRWNSGPSPRSLPHSIPSSQSLLPSPILPFEASRLHLQHNNRQLISTSEDPNLSHYRRRPQPLALDSSLSSSVPSASRFGDDDNGPPDTEDVALQAWASSIRSLVNEARQDEHPIPARQAHARQSLLNFAVNSSDDSSSGDSADEVDTFRVRHIEHGDGSILYSGSQEDDGEDADDDGEFDMLTTSSVRPIISVPSLSISLGSPTIPMGNWPRQDDNLRQDRMLRIVGGDVERMSTIESIGEFEAEHILYDDFEFQSSVHSRSRSRSRSLSIDAGHRQREMEADRGSLVSESSTSSFGVWTSARTTLAGSLRTRSASASIPHSRSVDGLTMTSMRDGRRRSPGGEGDLDDTTSEYWSMAESLRRERAAASGASSFRGRDRDSSVTWLDDVDFDSGEENGAGDEPALVHPAPPS